MLDRKTYDNNGRYTIHAYDGARHRRPLLAARDWRERFMIAGMLIALVLLTVMWS